MTTTIPSEEQVLEWMTSLSNWGRWGEDDQLGCLNLITESKRKKAAELIQDGSIVSCARPITTEMSADVSEVEKCHHCHATVESSGRHFSTSDTLAAAFAT